MEFTHGRKAMEKTIRGFDDFPATPAEYAVFINLRATKIIRDKLPKAGLKDARAVIGVRNYLLKGADKKELNKISAADFERLLTALEKATPKRAAALVKRTRGFNTLPKRLPRARQY